MREDQIVRYGRQILLRDLGGKGQERLLASPVRVLGGGPALDEAISYLLAGGTPIELAPGVAVGAFLFGAEPTALNPDAVPSCPAVADLLPHELNSEASQQVVVGAGVAFRTAQACDACWVTAKATLQAAPTGPVGSLGALTMQRLLLGWSEPLGVVHWRGDRFETAALPPCEHGPKTQQKQHPEPG